MTNGEKFKEIFGFTPTARPISEDKCCATKQCVDCPCYIEHQTDCNDYWNAEYVSS